MTKQSCDNNDSEEKCPKHFKLLPFKSFIPVVVVEDPESEDIYVDNVGVVDIELELNSASKDKVGGSKKVVMKPGAKMSVHPGVGIDAHHVILKIYNTTDSTAHFTIERGIVFGGNSLAEEVNQ